MRTTKRGGSFFLCLLLNIALNIEGIIPAAVLLVLHFALQWPLWLSFCFFALWIVIVFIRMAVIRYVSRCSNSPEKAHENKNPYSNK